VDGDFGPATEKAVKDYQKKNGITVTGRVDVETYHAILKV
jgi:peptidoglycan hydrolase-like protein with peptidoglycan-binding domain